MNVLFATTNKSKIKHYVPYLKERGIELVTLDDLNIKSDVSEEGQSPIENAIIKAQAYSKIANMITIASDEGLYLDNVPDDVQPKTHVRRVNGARLDDKEMIEHYIGLVNKYGNNGILTGYFVKGIAITDGDSTYSFDYKTERCFSNKQSPIISEGYPLASIQYITTFHKFKSELTDEEARIIKDGEQQKAFEFIINTLKKINKVKVK